jgi:thiamine biosynthesis lipoprotein
MKLWGFGSTETIQIPDDKKVQSVLELMDSYRLNINNLNSIKSSKHLALDLDGIAQGYCVDQLSSFLMQKGIENYIVELGGEIYLSGNDSMKRPWLVGLDNNLKEGGGQQQTFLSGMNKVGITSSGSHQKFKKIGDRYFSHILDPRTGYPVQNGIITVTVMAPTAMQADALDNAFMVMGIKDSFEWAGNHPNIGIYFTYLDVNGEVADTANVYFKQFLQTRNGN